MSRRWVAETIHDDIGVLTSYEATRVIREAHTGQQDLVLFENPFFGRILVLDGAVQLTTRDEFIYHEMMAHVPLFAHGAARQVLIVGGGDGGVAREVLKHREVESVTQVEIDRAVVDLAREHLPEISAGAFDDPRLDLVIADGAEFVADARDAYDVILVDSTDPAGPGAVLFSEPFYALASRALRAGGILTTQGGAPFVQERDLVSSIGALRASFADVWCYLASTPTYVFGPMAYGWASENPRYRRTDVATLTRRFEEAGLATRYYTPEVHAAAFALPAFIRDMVERA